MRFLSQRGTTQGCPLGPWCFAAAQAGNLDGLRWLMNRCIPNGGVNGETTGGSERRARLVVRDDSRGGA